jgi:hypothetical protein
MKAKNHRCPTSLFSGSWLAYPVVAAASLCFAGSAVAATNAWFASTGFLPDQVTTNWALSDTSVNDPFISAGAMTLSTAASSEGMFYRQTANLAIPANLTMEFRARMLSRNTVANNNSPMAIFFTTGSGVGNILYFGLDDLWLANGFLVRGPSASVDTDGAFHTYRIEVNGVASGSPIKVFYDNGALPLFTGALVTDATLNGSSQRIGFGDATAGDSGMTQWEYFYHNGSAVPVGVVPEPSAVALGMIGLGCIALWRRRTA